MISGIRDRGGNRSRTHRSAPGRASLWLLPAIMLTVGEAPAAELAAAKRDSGSGSRSAWAQWRGPYGTGISDARDIPVTWDMSNVVWTTPLEGRGHSSPVVWEDRIFLTTASEKGHRCSVVCVERKSGGILWKRTTLIDEPERIHNMNSWATPTCACDGELVVASFGSGGLHAYDLAGNKRWQQDLGRFENVWGSASSPIIIDDLVIQTCDADNVAFLVAFNKRDGKEVWRSPRALNRSFSTPVLIDTGHRQELVLNGHSGPHAYDPASGKELWSCLGGSGRGTPTVVTAQGMAIAISGRSRGQGDMMAVRLGGSGDVTETHRVWSQKRGGRDLPSPIVVGDYLCTVNLRPGLAACYDVATGMEFWKSRLAGKFSSSPVAVNGLVYLLSESGETFVIKPDRTYREVARNPLNADESEVFRASLVPFDGAIYCRSDKRLYCISQ